MRSKKYIKGFLEDIVLHLIDKNGEMYGYEITKKVRELTNDAINVTEGALYPILHKLENQGELSVDFKNSNGRLRKYYSLTEQGKRTTSEADQELSAFLNGLTQIFNISPAK